MKAGIAIGSNLGDRAAAVERAFAFLERLSPGHCLRSPILETAPVDCPPGSGAFLNAAAEIEFSGSPRELLARLHEHERSEGRKRSEEGRKERNAPRAIDLDLLYFGDRVISEADLVVPHPRMAARRFVLEPLAAIVPGLILPGETATISTLLQRLTDESNDTNRDPIMSTDKTSWLLDAKRSGEKIASLTCYDYPTARLLDEAGVRLLLVGDSLGMVVLGYEDTTRVTLADVVHHTRAVARGVAVKGRATVVADLPYKTYETPEAAVTSAKALQAAGAHVVKLEGGRAFLPQIEAIIKAGIPFIGHLGMLPQSVKIEGGYHMKGKSEEEASALEADASALAGAGAVAIVLEMVIPEVTERITRKIAIPTIGIGSGEACDGQVLVVHDYVGMFPWFRPKFVRPDPEADLGPALRESARRFVVRTGARDWSQPEA